MEVIEQGRYNVPYNMGTWVILEMSYGEQTLEETVSTSWYLPWIGPGGHYID